MDQVLYGWKGQRSPFAYCVFLFAFVFLYLCLCVCVFVPFIHLYFQCEESVRLAGSQVTIPPISALLRISKREDGDDEDLNGNHCSAVH